MLDVITKVGNLDDTSFILLTSIMWKPWWIKAIMGDRDWDPPGNSHTFLIATWGAKEYEWMKWKKEK